jgi:hypothetical protein
MRTSNKILLGLILTTIFVFASLFISVRVKYARGSIVTREPVNRWSDVHRFKEPIREVRITGLGDILIVPADSARLEIWKDNQRVKWRMKDGVLYVEVDSTRQQGERGQMIYGHIELFLPATDNIIAVNSHIVVKNIADSNGIKPNYNFQLHGTELTFDANYRNEGLTYYDKIKVDANPGSALHFNGKLWVNELQARLSQSAFVDGDASFGKLSLQTDSTSDITIEGFNLRKAIITSTE